MDDLHALADQLDVLVGVVRDLVVLQADLDRGLARLDAFRRTLGLPVDTP